MHDFPASGSDSRFATFASGGRAPRRMVGDRAARSEEGGGCKKGGSISARILISSPRCMVPRCISRLRPALAFRRTTRNSVALCLVLMRKTAFTGRETDGGERREIEGSKREKEAERFRRAGYLLNERTRLLGDEIPLSRWFTAPRLRYTAAFLYIYIYTHTGTILAICA